jgi:hypothetical protein
VDNAQKVQVAHRTNNRMTYPPQAQKRKQIQLDTNYVFKLQVRKNLLNVSLNHEHLISHQLPQRYKEGHIELLAFDAIAEFNEISVRELPFDTKLQPPTSLSPDLAKVDPTELPKAKLKAAQAKVKSIKARIAADKWMIQHSDIDISNEVIADSILTHKEYLVAQAEVDLLTAKAGKKAAAEKKLADARKALDRTVVNIPLFAEAEWHSFPMSIKNLNTPRSMRNKALAVGSHSPNGSLLRKIPSRQGSQSITSGCVTLGHHW